MKGRNEMRGVALRVDALVCGLVALDQYTATDDRPEKKYLLVLGLPAETSIFI